MNAAALDVIAASLWGLGEANPTAVSALVLLVAGFALAYVIRKLKGTRKKGKR